MVEKDLGWLALNNWNEALYANNKEINTPTMYTWSSLSPTSGL